MKKIFVLLIASVLLFSGVSMANNTRWPCINNHNKYTGPTGVQIGIVAGWEALSEFFNEGGYGVDQSVEDDIDTLVEAYQDYEYIPLQLDAEDVWSWLDSIHGIDPGDDSVICSYCNIYHTQSEFVALRNGKADRLCEINGEIDDDWQDLVDTCIALINADQPDAIDEYIDDMSQ